jgi:hypothetical protein
LHSTIFFKVGDFLGKSDLSFLNCLSFEIAHCISRSKDPEEVLLFQENLCHKENVQFGGNIQ